MSPRVPLLLRIWRDDLINFYSRPRGLCSKAASPSSEHSQGRAGGRTRERFYAQPLAVHRTIRGAEGEREEGSGTDKASSSMVLPWSARVSPSLAAADLKKGEFREFDCGVCVPNWVRVVFLGDGFITSQTVGRTGGINSEFIIGNCFVDKIKVRYPFWGTRLVQVLVNLKPQPGP